mmetsp:Transcript_23486/g.79635  ORF Transcript_23486/g.79635 Transcript_23486/m.79635 type:complete len:288 (+) Transcript_23486:2296-3159(+)
MLAQPGRQSRVLPEVRGQQDAQRCFGQSCGVDRGCCSQPEPVEVGQLVRLEVGAVAPKLHAPPPHHLGPAPEAAGWRAAAGRDAGRGDLDDGPRLARPQRRRLRRRPLPPERPLEAERAAELCWRGRFGVRRRSAALRLGREGRRCLDGLACRFGRRLRRRPHEDGPVVLELGPAGCLPEKAGPGIEDVVGRPCAGSEKRGQPQSFQGERRRRRRRRQCGGFPGRQPPAFEELHAGLADRRKSRRQRGPAARDDVHVQAGCSRSSRLEQEALQELRRQRGWRQPAPL